MVSAKCFLGAFSCGLRPGWLSGSTVIFGVSSTGVSSILFVFLVLSWLVWFLDCGAVVWFGNVWDPDPSRGTGTVLFTLRQWFKECGSEVGALEMVLGPCADVSGFVFS